MARQLPPVRVTRRGWALLGTAFVGLVVAYASGWPALLAVALFLAALVGAGVLAVVLVPTRATAERRLAPEITEPGRPVTVRLTIAGHAAAGAEWRDDTTRRLEVIGSAKGRLPRLGADLAAVEVEYAVIARRRGRIPVGPLLVERTDPLGVATAKRRSGEAAVLTVLPALHEVRPPVAATRVDLDPDAAAVFGLAGEQRDIIAREYRAGDPLRSVDWRSTAHRGELMVRSEAAAASVSTALAFDVRQGVWRDERSFEWGVEAAASLLAAVGRRSSAVRFVHDPRTPVVIDADRALMALATITRTEDGPAPAELVRRIRGQDVQVLHLLTGVGALRELGHLPPLSQGAVGIVSLVGDPLEPVPPARGWHIHVLDPNRPVEEAWAMREARGDGVLSAAGAGAVLVAALSFLPIVQGADWWWAAMIFTVAATAVSAWARSLGAPTAAGAVLGLTTMPLLATALDGQGRGVLLLFPTAGSSNAVLQVLNDAWVQIYADTVPAEPSPGILLLIAAGAATAAVLVDAVAVGLGAPLPAMLVVLALAIVPGKALHTGTSGWLLAGVAVAVLLVVAADRRRRGSAPRVAGLVTGGAVALVLALLAQVVLPAPFVSDAQGLPLQPLFGSGADPLIRLGDNLRRGPEEPVLSYSTSTDDDVYLRLAVLENFTGATWSPNEADRYGVGVNDHAPAAPGLASDSGPTITTRITAANDDSIGQRLPLTYPAKQVNGVFGFDWDSRGLTLVRRDTTSTVGTYTVQSLAVDTSAAQLKNATTSPPADDRGSIDVPGSVPSIIRTTASSWAKGARTPYAIALAIQNHLRGGQFIYDEQTPVQQGYDGDGLGVIAKFLSVKSGYCVHFASTMAVMARLEGIPARVVVGYQPGTRSLVDGHNVYTVTSDDLHAWPELYFDGIGWVRFEPTPGRGAVPTYAPQPGTSQASDALPNKADRVSATPSAVPSTTPSAAAGAGSGGDGGSALPGVLRGLGIAVLVALVLLLPAGLRRSVRRRRLARLSRGAPADVAWQEVLDTAADLGLAPRAGLSLRAAELALGRRLGGSPSALSALGRVRSAYERQAYGGRDQQVAAGDVAAVIAAIRDAASFPVRLRADLAPRSLLRGLPRVPIRPLRPVVPRP